MSELYLVQVGKGPKGRYINKYSISNLAQAGVLYDGINLDEKHKKRLIRNSDSLVLKCAFGWK